MKDDAARQENRDNYEFDWVSIDDGVIVIEFFHIIIFLDRFLSDIWR